MKIECNLPARKPAGGLALTLGVFDGVHRGHLAILRSLKRRAEQKNLKTAVLTFDRHPATVLAPHAAPLALTGTNRKMSLLDAAGIDKTWLLPFTASFSRQTAEDFVEKILVKRLGVCEVVIGYDFVFGKQGRGDRGLLAKLSKHYGFGLSAVGPTLYQGKPISSTRIRAALIAGEVQLAAAMLGRSYRLHGKVVRGKGLGKKMGWPTANLRLDAGVMPKAGVWGGQAWIDQEKKAWPFIANWGTRPTLEKKGSLRLEAHLLDFNGNLRGKNLHIEFEHYLRGEKKFSSLSVLKKQIARDEFAFRRHLKH